MTEAEARELANDLIHHKWLGQLSPEHTPSLTLKALTVLREEIVLLLLDAAKVEPGHVRLPDGRDVPVLGELPMSEDDCAVGSDATLYRIAPDGSSEVLLTKHLSSGWYSTRAAAEAARAKEPPR